MLIPLLVLGTAEVALRVAGYGYPTGFFLKSRVGGRAVYIENQKFGYRFFPRALARVPEPEVLPVEKPPGTYRIFVFGESAALGDPAPAFGLPRMLALLLRERYPSVHFEVVNAAMTAINSHAILPIARDAARLNGDLWVIYMGHNEVFGPFGAGTVFGPQAPSLPIIRAQIALKQTRLGQWLSSLPSKLGREAGPPKKWAGMEMFTQQQVRPDDPRRQRVCSHFRHNLADLLAAGKKAGVKVLVSTTAANLKDCGPFGSQHVADLTAAARQQWETAFAAGLAAESQKHFPEALEHYLKAAKIDDRFAELQFRLGRCRLGLGKPEEARASFVAARDLDALPFRADSQLNRIIRETAGQRAAEGIYLHDAGEALARQSPDGLCGEELFYEHVHLNFAGNYALARSLAEDIAALLPASVVGNPAARTNFLSADECADRLAYTDWDQYQIIQKMSRRVQEAPFNQQPGHEERDDWLRQRLAELEPKIGRLALEAATQQYRRALAGAGDDWVLHDHFAQLLVAAGNPGEAEREWRRVLELTPHYFVAYYQLAGLLNGVGRTADAERNFLAALRLRPESAEAWYGLGLTLAKEGNLPEAIQHFEKALKFDPDLGEAYVNWGLALARQGRNAEAKQKYEQALRVKPDSAPAHLNLGLALAAQKQFKEAIEHYSAAVELAPNDARARFSLANALVAVGRVEEAKDQYAQTLLLNPNYAEAHLNLGVEYARQNQTEQAAKHFSDALRINPDYADAHFNLGELLAKQGRIVEAAQELDATLRSDPANAQARKLLQGLEKNRKAPVVR